jgi:hypothetical protein
MYDCWLRQRWIFDGRRDVHGEFRRLGWPGLAWGEAFEVSRHSLRTIPFDSMSFADSRIEAGVEELTHVTSNAMWRKVDGCNCGVLARLS